MAHMPFSPCDDASTCTDISVSMLRHIFGGIIDALVTGDDPDTVLASGNILATMFGFFNSGILIIGSLIVSYVAIMGTLNTANDGEAMGHNWSSLWTPLRIVTGGAVLLPTTSGFSFIQLIVMMFALWGVGFANGTYKTGMAMGILSPNGIAQGVNQPGTYYGLREFARQYLAVSYCAHAANHIYAYGGISPEVQADRLHDKLSTVGGRSEYTFYVKDRNASTNLGGGEPFCGTVNIVRYTAQAMNDPTATALEKLRVIVQEKKVIAVAEMMSEIRDWVNTWPADINQPEWDSVDSNHFNIIVKKYEEKIADDLVMAINEIQSDVNDGLSVFVNSLTSDGWSAAGGWLQRVGMVRGQITHVMTESVGTVTEPSLSGLPSDVRFVLFSNSVTTITQTINQKSEEKISYAAANTANLEDIASVIPKDAKSDINPGAIKANIDSKMSSFVNNLMQSSVEMVTGANDTGTMSFCGVAGQMGGSLNRIKCVGDYLTLALVSVGAADVAIKTGVTTLRVVAGGVASVTILGNSVEMDKMTDPFWDWLLEVPVKQLAVLYSYLEPMAFYFGVFLPSLPYTVFMIVVVGWILAVLQSVIAAPLWAVMHMTPDRTFIGSQTQGYLLLLSLFARPTLAVMGLFAAILVSDPIIDYIAKGFFSMRGAIVSSTGTVGAITEFLTFAWWFMVFGLTLLPVLYMIFSLPQILPDHVLRWIGAGNSDLGETGAVGQMRGGIATLGSHISSSGKSGNPPRARLGNRSYSDMAADDHTPRSRRSHGGEGGRREVVNVNPQGIAPVASDSFSTSGQPGSRGTNVSNTHDRTENSTEMGVNRETQAAKGTVISAAAMVAGVSRVGATDSPSVIAAMPVETLSSDPLAHPRDRFGNDTRNEPSPTFLKQEGTLIDDGSSSE